MPDIIPAPPTPNTGGGPPLPPQNSTTAPTNGDPRERKEDRRRERRARRERHRQRQRQTELSNQMDAYMYEGGGGGVTSVVANNVGISHNLPDLVSHPPPPPYATLPPQGSTSLLCPAGAGNTRGGGWRASISSFSRRRRRHGGDGAGALIEEEPKPCCGVLVSQSVSIRWFIVMIAFVGICCAVVGTVLGAMKATGREHLTVSLLMIGVGVVLITVSGIAWRMTSRDAPSCRAMMGLDPHAEYGIGGDTRFMQPRGLPYPRTAHPYAGMLYSEFQYRPPPPSYQASMQEYRLRLLLMDRNAPAPTHPATAAANLVSPPPAYRGMPGIGRLGIPDVSRPPSYRSRASDACTHPAIVHARHSSQLSYLSQQTIQEDPAKDGELSAEHASVVPVLHNGNMHKASIIIHGDGGEQVCIGKQNYISNIQNQFDLAASKADFGNKTASSTATTAKPKAKDDVTIVQKEETPADGGPVVVTVSATVDRQNSSTCSTPELDILAHL